jgi:hypothetical protein
MHMSEHSIKTFFDVYPDGKLISILRDPKGWFASARRHGPEEYGDLRRAIALWKRSASAMLENIHRYGSERVCVIKFEDLITNTEKTMRFLCEWLSIDFDEILLIPTFNRMPIRANSAFSVKGIGIIKAPVRRGEQLSGTESEEIDKETHDIYALVSEVAVKV